MAKIFTLGEAQTLLPVLRNLLRAAMDAQHRGEELDAELQRIITRILLLGGVQLDPVQLARLKSDREKCSRAVKDAMNEITAAGAQVKDLKQGLLDFPCLYEGRVVLLCWKMGEDAIEHWHGTEEGFAGRKKIDPAVFQPNSKPRLN